MSDVQERGYYMVRAMASDPKDFDVFFSNSVVAIGWSDIDFTKYSDSKKIREVVYENILKNSGKAPQKIGKDLNEIERFKNIKEGDCIIIPYYSSIVLATAEAEEYYSNDETSEQRDLKNQRKVTYLLKNEDKSLPNENLKDKLLILPRNVLSEGLQRRLRVPGSAVLNLFEFKKEIDKIFEKNEQYSYTNEINERIEKKRIQFKEKLIEIIRNGGSNLSAGGIGLENLIKELLELEGYTAEILPKQSFEKGIDADILASKSDSFNSVRLLIQVKHHNWITDSSGIDQLLGVIKKQEYENCIGILFTSADVLDDTRTYAESNGIKVMNGNDLADLIISNLDKLSNDTKNKLGINPYPAIIEPNK